MEVARHCETYWHGWLAMTALRIEADAADTAGAAHDLDAIEHAQARADAILATWKGAVAVLHGEDLLVQAYSRGIDAEIARMPRGRRRRVRAARG